MFAFKVVCLCVALVQLDLASAVDSRPNSLQSSLQKTSNAWEYVVCKRTVSLTNEVNGDLLDASLNIDRLLSTANKELENLYSNIGTILELIVKEKKWNKQLKKQILDAIQSLINNANGLIPILSCTLSAIDLEESAIIDQVLGSLNAVNELDCDCACPVPKHGVSLIEGTARSVQKCVAAAEEQIRWALIEACDRLGDVIKIGVRKSGNIISDAQIALSLNVVVALGNLATCNSGILEKVIPAASSLLSESRTCLKENS